jgi:hypothetical protein
MNPQGFQFDDEFYFRNEAIFFSLIFNTKKDTEIAALGIELMDFTNVMT